MSERVWQHLAGEPADDPYTADPRSPFNGRVRVGSEREGFKQRVAYVEMLLTEAAGLLSMVDARRQQRGKARLDEALAEVRSMIDGDETPS